jgi:hypothetical protein
LIERTLFLFGQFRKNGGCPKSFAPSAPSMHSFFKIGTAKRMDFQISRLNPFLFLFGSLYN